ncbi:MAG: SDR family oxidoreductase [Scytolyngbya sp. HA4215-MV1]|nr:SDR family oxidoreductase [Scytolyngbya sp. HA4215-MV1]
MTLTKPIVLILGATGKTGSHLVNLLEPDFDRLELRIAIRKPKQADQFSKRGISHCAS